MKKKLLATLFMVCFIFVFAPKTVHAYSYYWYVNPIDTLYSDIAEKKNFYLAGKESKYGIEGNFDNKPQWNVKSPNKKEVKLNFFVKIVN